MFVGCVIVGAITVAFTNYYLRFTGCTATAAGNITVSGGGSKVYLDGCGPWAGDVCLSGVNCELIRDETNVTGTVTISGAGSRVIVK